MATPHPDGSITLTTSVDTDGLNKGTRNIKSEVAKLAQEYKKTGFSASEAFKKAWVEIDRTTQATKNLGKQSKQTHDTMSKGINNFNTLLSTVAKKMLALVGIYQLISFGKTAIDLASDVEEVQNVVDTAFGEMSYRMEEFAKIAVETYGISQLTAKRTGSTYMAMGRGMGLAAKDAAEMALTLTALSADIASFYNMAQSEADTMIKSIYTGETETLKQIGVVMTEVNLQQFAYTQGINKNISAMTQQEKTMLRYQFVLAQTAMAHGDFAKTANSWANLVRVLNERWKEMQAIFGEAFIAIGSIVLPILNSIITGLTYIAKIAIIVAQNIASIFGKQIEKSTSETAVNIGSMASSTQDTANNMGDVAKSTKAAAKEAKKAIADFDQLSILASNATSGANGAGGGVGGIDAGMGGLEGATISGGGDLNANETVDEVIVALARLGKAIGMALVAVGVLLLFTGNIAWGVGFIITGAFLYSVSQAALGESDINKAQTALETLNTLIPGFLVAIGLILLFLGQVPWGVGFIIVGAIWFGVNEAKKNEEDVTGQVHTMIYAIAQAVGSALFVIGVILLVFGQIPLGLGFIITGASLLQVSSVGLKESGVTTKINDFFEKNRAILVAGGIVFVVLGLLLMFTGVGIGLGFGLLLAGAVVLGQAVNWDWDYAKNKITVFFEAVRKVIVGVAPALLTIGILLAMTGAAMPLGLGLIAIGASALATELTENWDTIQPKVEEVFNNIKNWVKTWGILVLGIVLLFTGVGMPLGLGLIKAASTNFAEAEDPLWDTMLNSLKETWLKIEAWWNENVAEWFTKDKWIALASNIGLGLKQGFESAINNVITIVEKGINYIVESLNKISFDVPDFIPGIGGKSFGISLNKITIPKVALANGGIVPRATNALIGEAGAEAVLPLENNTEWMSVIADGIAQILQNNTTSSQPIILELDGRELGRAIIEQGNRENRRVGTKLVIV